jgi:hypothetical protein
MQVCSLFEIVRIPAVREGCGASPANAVRNLVRRHFRDFLDFAVVGRSVASVQSPLIFVR